MEMRTIVPILVIAVTFCFDPATSSCIKDGKEGTKQGTDTVSRCLQKAMAKGSNAVDGVIEFLCSYMKYKNTTNKEELIQAIESLEEVTGCGTEDIFGSDASLLRFLQGVYMLLQNMRKEQLHLDENSVLTSQIIAMKEHLKHYILLPITAPVCALLDNIENSTDFATQNSAGKVQGHKRATRNVLSLVGGLAGGLGGLGGLLNLLGLVGTLLSPLGPLLNGLSGVTNIVGGLGNGVAGLLGGLTGGLLGGGQNQGDLLGGLLGGVGGTLGGLTGTLGGLTGGLTGGLLGGGSGGSNVLGLLGR